MVAPRALVFRPLVKGNEDSGSEIVTGSKSLSALLSIRQMRVWWFSCVWGRLGQGNHVIIVTSSFSKKAHFSKCFPTTLKHNAGVLESLRFKGRFRKAPFGNFSRLVWTVGLVISGLNLFSVLALLQVIFLRVNQFSFLLENEQF